MNIEDILSEIDAEIARLQQAKALLGNTAHVSGTVIKRKPGRPPSNKTASTTAAKNVGKRRTMSPEGRARIAAAQKARWAKTKRAAKKATKAVGKGKLGRPAKSVAKKASAKKVTSAKPESVTA